MLKGRDFVPFVTKGVRGCVLNYCEYEDGRFIRASFKFKSINMKF